MAFVQIVDYKTSNFDQMQKNSDEWFAATEGRRTTQRGYVCRDRNDPEHYVIVAVFDSYESAMENSNLPETQEFAAKQAELSTDMSFTDLDVIEERS